MACNYFKSNNNRAIYSKGKTYQRFFLVFLLFLQSFIFYLDRTCIASAVDNIKHDLAISSEIMGFVLSVFAIGYALFQIPTGYIVDRFSPRRVVTCIVVAWSFFTLLTGMVRNIFDIIIVRFLFGASEAGAYPCGAQILLHWLPMKERSIAYGVNYSGNRLGAAFALFFMPWLILQIGWRKAFIVNGILGFMWVMIWLIWFCNDPKDNPRISQAELDHIASGNIVQENIRNKTSFTEIFTSFNMILTMMQYFASNVTFFVAISWLPSYIKNQWPNDAYAIYYSAIPLIFAACSNWIAGTFVMKLFGFGYKSGSLRIPAILGFILGVIGLLSATQINHISFLTTEKANLYWFIFSLAIATFGVDMTVSPSWTFCNYIGQNKSGAVSGAMNMVGNIGSAISAIIFPFMIDVTTGSANAFFYLAAFLNGGAIIAWCFMNPYREISKRSAIVLRRQFIIMISFLFLITLIVIGYKFFPFIYEKIMTYWVH